MSYTVTIEPIGEQIEVEEGQTILQAALRQGVWLPFACGHGTCATCKVQVIEGDVNVGEASPFALMDSERDDGKVLACCATVESDVTIEADIDVDEDFEGYPVEDYQATVTKIVDLSPTIKGVHLKLDRGMTFQSGQYINIELPGVDGQRAFSMANPPSRADEVELHVRLVAGGGATSYVHKQLSVGDSLNLSGPYGQFFVRSSQPGDLMFVAGGSGLSSPQCMILDLLEQNDERQIVLFQGARNAEELYNRELFETLARDHDNFTYVPALSQADEDTDWQGFRGYVHDAAKAHFDGRFSGQKAYLCGPPPMIDAAVTALMQGRLFERDIFMEKFLTAADGAEDAQRSALFKKSEGGCAMGESFQITEQFSGEQFRCKPGQSVLKAMEQKGLKCVPVGCRCGGCGFCKVTVLGGDYECGKMSRVHASPEAINQGEVLACRVYPLTDLIIECQPQSIVGLDSEHTTTKAIR